jgi:hypothetical protein
VRNARLLVWAAGAVGPKWPKAKVFPFYFSESNFDANFCANFLSNDIICSDNSKVIKVLLKNIMRMLKLFPLRT